MANTDLITVTVTPVEFKNPLLTAITAEIYDAVQMTENAIDTGLRAVSVCLAKVAATPDMLKEDGFKSVKEYGHAIGLKDSTIYSLSAAGRMYLDPDISDTVKTLSPSKIRELSNVTKKGNAETVAAVNRDADALVNMTQAELRDYTAKAIDLTNAGRLKSDTASVLNPDDIEGDAENLPAPSIKAKLEKVYESMEYIQGSLALHGLIYDEGTETKIPYEIDFALNDEPYTLQEFKTMMKDLDIKVFNAGLSPIEIDGKTPVRYVLVSPFNEVQMVSLREYKPETEDTTPTVVPLTTEEVKQLAMWLATDEISLGVFEDAKTGKITFADVKNMVEG